MFSPDRRKFLFGLGSTVALPAIVRAENIAKVRGVILRPASLLIQDWLPIDGEEIESRLYPDLCVAIMREYGPKYVTDKGARLPLWTNERELRKFVQPDIARELATPEFQVATRDLKLNNGLFVPAGTVIPIGASLESLVMARSGAAISRVNDDYLTRDIRIVNIMPKGGIDV